MTSTTQHSTTASSPSPSRSLLSYLRAPLQSKTRNFTDFSIQPDDPHRQYAPGDIISGTVIVKVLKPLRITHLVISLHGHAQVFKNPNAPGDAYKNYAMTVGSGKGKRSGGYFGNGFVSLFEDEVVLCGEGRLREGKYHFNFELEFPTKGLPSSIKFERGIIAYVLTATLTRPNTISPTSSCEAPVQYADIIDIGSIPNTKPRTISLEPVSRRARNKPPRRRPQTQENGQAGASESADSTRNGRLSDLQSVGEEVDLPGSPAPSDVSFESRVSSGNSGTEYGVRSVNTAVDGFSTRGPRTPLKGKTITATVEVGSGGFLRGDMVPIRISVNHTKHVRSLKGIIVTLYRQARVDMHPALPLAPHSRGDKTRSEDYYPRSRTGLGGLSLSSAGSSHLFRKDLSQTFAPLFVDPRTLTADVKCAVRVPDDAFPTITNVPGAMISFKYFIEVVIDIQGKLSGLDRMLPGNGLMSMPLGVESDNNGSTNATGTMFSGWGGTFADTDSLRRERGVVHSLFEVVVGTKDSARNGKRRQQPQDALSHDDIHDIPPGSHNASSGSGTGNPDFPEHEGHYGGDHDTVPTDDVPGYSYRSAAIGHPQYHPPLHLDHEAELSEKERIKRAEARLLPSSPPAVASTSASHGIAGVVAPSAPVLSDDLDPPSDAMAHASGAALPSSSSSQLPPFIPSIAVETPTPPLFARSSSRPSLTERSRTISNDRSVPTLSSSASPATIGHHQDALATHLSRSAASPPLGHAPEYSPSPSSILAQPTDDKQELQRRRLELDASAPPTIPTSPLTSGEPSAPPMHEDLEHLPPSAPMLNDEDEGLVDAVRPDRLRDRHRNRDHQAGSRRISEALPEYQQ